MYKNRRNKNHNNWNGGKNNNAQKNNNRDYKNEQNNQKKFEPSRQNYEDENVLREKRKAISELKTREVICKKCGHPILEIASALADKQSGSPIHFECAIKEIEASEKVGENEKIAYIGQGRFGVLSYDNIRDQKHFTIKKVIEWEVRDKKASWREEVSDLYSKVN